MILPAEVGLEVAWPFVYRLIYGGTLCGVYESRLESIPEEDEH